MQDQHNPSGFPIPGCNGVEPIAVHLVGRHMNERRFGAELPGCQQVEGSERIDFEIEEGMAAALSCDGCAAV